MPSNPPLSNHSISLDIDATLVCSNDDMQKFESLQIYTNPQMANIRSRIYTIKLLDVVDPPGSGVITPMWGVFRPHVHEFIAFASVYFKHVNIWSAGQNKYVNAISSLLFPDPAFQPTIIYDWENCEKGTNFVHKPLIKMYGDPQALQEMTPANTFALDDRDDTFAINPLNGIRIPPYEPQFTPEGIMAEDEALLQLMYWLSLPHVRYATDIGQLDKTRIFTTPLSTYLKMIDAEESKEPNEESGSANGRSDWLSVRG
jgi:hypothetical protein